MADGWEPVGTVRRRKSVTLDATGAGELDFDVYSANTRWIITQAFVQTNQAQSTAPYPTVTVQLGGLSQGQAEGGTWTGNMDIFNGRVEMNCCDTLSFLFTGGVAGSVATVSIEGENYLWRGQDAQSG